jgi:hypothetical protein
MKTLIISLIAIIGVAFLGVVAWSICELEEMDWTRKGEDL